jgi:predicted outer membrane repeat protein
MKSETSTAQIKCINNSSMHFSQSQSIHITNLEFIGCGGNQIAQVKEFLVMDTKFEGRENSGTALELIGTTAQIVNSAFVSNRRGSYRESFQDDFDVFVGGAIIATDNTTVTISQSKFEDNKADFGGAIFADNYSIINLTDNVSFVNNSADGFGGVLYSSTGVITTINASTFYNNTAYNVVLIGAFTSTLTIEASVFYDNVANVGVLFHHNSSITIEASEFHDNVALLYDILYSFNSNMTIEGSVFYSNRASNGRGVLYSEHSTITVGDCNFTNHSSPVISAYVGSTIQYHNHLLIDRNLGFAVVYLFNSELRGNDSGKLTGIFKQLWITSSC